MAEERGVESSGASSPPPAMSRSIDRPVLRTASFSAPSASPEPPGPGARQLSHLGLAQTPIREAAAMARQVSMPSTRHLHELLRRIAAGETVLPGGMGIHKQMLILDPISAFYWIDTMESSEELRIFKRVCQLISSLDMAIFAAKSPLYMRRERDAHREYLGESWARLVKYRLVLWPELQTDLGSSDSSQPGRPPSEPRHARRQHLPSLPRRARR